MIFDGPLADVEIHGDILAGMACYDPLHDVMLTMGKTREALVCSFTEPEHLQDQFVSFARDAAPATHRLSRLFNGHSRESASRRFVRVWN
jgi:hypothetical protein